MIRRSALVFGPVQPAWDDGAFFAPITERLYARGVDVRLVDTVALIESSMTVEELADRWYDELKRQAPADLICGNALGGAVAHAFAARHGDGVPVLSVSGPGRSDALLAQRLEEIAALAALGDLDAALTLLQRRVVANGAEPSAAPTGTDAYDRLEAARRLSVGLRALCEIDLAPALTTYPGLILTLVGSASQLVAERHALTAPRAQTVVFEGAGMRPHHDRPQLLDMVVDTLIAEMDTPPWK